MEIAKYFLESNPMVALLIIAILGLVTFIKIVDTRNMKITNERIEDLKNDVKISKLENKELKETFNAVTSSFENTMKETRKDNETSRKLFEQAISSFNDTTRIFNETTTKINRLDSEITNMKNDLVEIKIKIDK